MPQRSTDCKSTWFDYTTHEGTSHPVYKIETLSEHGPDCRVLNPNVFGPLDIPIRHSPVVSQKVNQVWYQGSDT